MALLNHPHRPATGADVPSTPPPGASPPRPLPRHAGRRREECPSQNPLPPGKHRVSRLRARIARGAATTVTVLLAVLLAACDPDYDAARPRSPGIKIVTDSVGTGPLVEEGDMIAAHYVGRLSDGTVIIDTRTDADPHRWIVGDGTVIKGMDQAVRGMRAGGVREVVIPPELHWGRAGYGGVVPENVAVRFRIELRSVR